MQGIPSIWVFFFFFFLLRIDFFHFYFLNSHMFVNIQVMNMKFSVWFLKIRLEGSLSQIFYLGPSFYVLSKNG